MKPFPCFNFIALSLVSVLQGGSALSYQGSVRKDLIANEAATGLNRQRAAISSRDANETRQTQISEVPTNSKLSDEASIKSMMSIEDLDDAVDGLKRAIENDDVSAKRDVDNAAWLKPRFDYLYDHELVTDPIPLTGSLVIGLLSAPTWSASRNLHRALWRRQRCISPSGVRQGHVTPRFMIESFASPQLQKEQDEFGDIVFLDVLRFQEKFKYPLDEYAHALKPLAWMQYASDHFSDANYIGKADSDTFFSPCELLADLNTRNPPFYYGNQNRDNETYMQGGLYVLSHEVANWLRVNPFASANPPNPPDPWNFVTEDKTMGFWVDEAKKIKFPTLEYVYVGCDLACHYGPCGSWDPCHKQLYKHLYRRTFVGSLDFKIVDVMAGSFARCSFVNRSANFSDDHH